MLLDNCEHLLQAVARFVYALVTRCPAVSVLATSRERLGVPGEVVWSVPTLSLPAAATAAEELPGTDAVAFFCERARAARPAFELDHTNGAAVLRICRRLDGIPLALELAAARIRVLSPAQLASRLDDRFRLLTGRDASSCLTTKRCERPWTGAMSCFHRPSSTLWLAWRSSPIPSTSRQPKR